MYLEILALSTYQLSILFDRLFVTWLAPKSAPKKYNNFTLSPGNLRCSRTGKLIHNLRPCSARPYMFDTYCVYVLEHGKVSSTFTFSLQNKCVYQQNTESPQC